MCIYARISNWFPVRCYWYLRTLTWFSCFGLDGSLVHWFLDVISFFHHIFTEETDMMLYLFNPQYCRVSKKLKKERKKEVEKRIWFLRLLNEIWPLFWQIFFSFELYEFSKLDFYIFSKLISKKIYSFNFYVF